MNFKLSKDVEKNPGPTHYNTDHHEVIIRPFMQNHSSTAQLTSPISSENLMQSRLGELGLQSIDVGGEGDCLFRSVSHQLYGKTPNANMADHSVIARDELHESEASEASVFCFDNASP